MFLMLKITIGANILQLCQYGTKKYQYIHLVGPHYRQLLYGTEKYQLIHYFRTLRIWYLKIPVYKIQYFIYITYVKLLYMVLKNTKDMATYLAYGLKDV
jgi:hypothetical protein